MADRYWVGASGTWNNSNTANWSTTSGGAGGASVPTSSDDVFIDSSSGNGLITITSTSICKDCTITWSAVKTNTLSLSGNFSPGGTLTITGNSTTNRLFIRSSVIGATRTITAATTILSNCDFQDITGAGDADWTGTSIGNALGNSGITFTTPVTRYAVLSGNWSNGSMWSTSSGGSAGASVPLCHDTVILNANSATGTYTADMPRLGADIDCTGFTRTLTTSTTASIFGSLTLSSGMTLTASPQTYTFAGRGSHTLTGAGKTWAKTIFLNGLDGTYTLQDDFLSTEQLTIGAGTLNANDKNVSASSLNAIGGLSSISRTVNMGSGNWTLSSSSTVFLAGIASPILTINAGTSTIIFSDNGGTTKTFQGGNHTYHNLVLSGSGSCQYTITGSNNFNKLESTKTVEHTIAFTGGTTQTIANWQIKGTSGNVVTLNSTTSSTYNIIKSGGGKVGSDYLNIQRCVASPEETWYAGLNSTDNQTTTGGSGWLFTFPLPIVSTQDVTDIESTAFTGNGTVVDNYTVPVVRRGFVVSTSSHTNPGDTDPEASTYGRIFDESGTFGTGAFDLPITDLEELKRYYIRAFAENGAGFSYGNEVISDTPETPERADVSIITIENTGMTTATAHAKIERTNNTATRRGVVLSRSVKSNPGDTSPEDSDYELVFSEIGTYSEGSFMQHITGLEKVKAYHVRAFVENSAGFSYSDKTSFISSLSVSPPTGIGIFIQS
jgi:hypothetical protein